ncbi:hypothetical protein ACJMK2_041083 [Sinanodonta woodiana]|uniref:DUF5580 domain-containing protein n=1 Tax=Sinanodonta woodiana TaxID=1069815 RepID=A0ABD3W663_SINWO
MAWFTQRPSTGEKKQKAKKLPTPPMHTPEKDAYGDEETQNELSEMNFLYQPNATLKHAPFGNKETPPISMKIISGKYIPVIEKQANQTNEDNYYGTRVHPIQPIADKPNHIDPRAYSDKPGAGYYGQSQDFSTYPSPRGKICCDLGICKYFPCEPTSLAHIRPDSKNVRRKLAPLQANRSKNGMSTVFEPEQWTGGKAAPLAADTEYKAHYNPFADTDNMNGYIDNREVDDLYNLVPKRVLLPTDPITLSPSEESLLKRLIAKDLENVTSESLKQVYMDACRFDRPALTGWCDMTHLDHVFKRNEVYIRPDNLRILIAQFVSPNRPGQVNYEQIVTFLGTARKMNDNKEGLRLNPVIPPPNMRHTWSPQRSSRQNSPQRQYDEKPKYYNYNNGQPASPTRSYPNRNVAILLRKVERELAGSSYAINWDKLFDDFQREDSGHRETLSAAQIKNILYENRVAIQDSLIQEILETECRGSNRDGQFRWQAFVDFLNRIRPMNTGLQIPVSKRPLEYAKQYPAPVPNWPKADDNRNGEREEPNYGKQDEPLPTVRQTRHDPPQQEPRYRDTSPPPRMQDDRNDYRDRPSPRGGGDHRAVFKEQIDKLEAQLHDLERMHQMDKEGLTSDTKPWHVRFLKMAEKLYEADATKKGI